MPTNTIPKKTSNTGETFAAMRYRNYRLWFIGQLVSLIGTWMQTTAQQYLIYDLTNSTFLLGLVTFFSGLPTIILTPFTGVIADRIPRRTLLVITQASMMVLAFILAVLKFTGVVQYWHILILAFLLGIANAFDAPARQSFAVELVDDRRHLTNAIALNSAMFNLATIVGPAASGMIYFLVGPAWCFTINGFSFIAVILALLLMRMPKFEPSKSEGNVFKDVSTGFKYVFSHNIILWLMITLGVTSLIGFGVANQAPAWAKSVLGGDERTNGWMVTFRGAGSLIGALLVASFGRRKIRGKLWVAGSIILPVSLGVLAVVPMLNIPNQWMVIATMALSAVMGGALMLIANTANATIQTDVPDNLRGRVMGIYTLIFMGSMPVGSLIIGAVAPLISLPVTVGVIAVLLMAVLLSVIFFNPRLRRMDELIRTDEPPILDERAGG